MFVGAENTGKFEFTGIIEFIAVYPSMPMTKEAPKIPIIVVPLTFLDFFEMFFNYL